MKLITYKNHEIIIDSNLVKIYYKNDLISKQLYIFYNEKNILLKSKAIINNLVTSNRRVNVYA